MEDNKQKFDVAALFDEEKLSEEELDEVAGGTHKETVALANVFRDREVCDTVQKMIAANPPERGYWDGLGTMTAKILNSCGIEADISTGGGVGIGSINNTYRDKQTGQFILHSEVIHFLKTGERPWH